VPAWVRPIGSAPSNSLGTSNKLFKLITSDYH
jgi:hypothetical protein